MQRTDWQQRCEDARENGEPPPGLVLTMHDADGRPSAELVVERGYRLVVSPSGEHFADGSIAARFTLERMP